MPNQFLGPHRTPLALGVVFNALDALPKRRCRLPIQVESGHLKIPFQYFPRIQRASGTPEDKINRTGQATSRPEKIQSDFFFHIENTEYREDAHRYHFLDNLELSQGEDLVTQPVGGYLEAILKQGHQPTGDDHQVNRLLLEILEVPVPGVGHEDIRYNQQRYGE